MSIYVQQKVTLKRLIQFSFVLILFNIVIVQSVKKDNFSDIKECENDIGLTVATTDKLAEYYFQTHNNIDTVKNHLDNTITFLNNNFESSAKKNVLDVGCGPARDVKYFINNNIEAIGVDLSTTTLEIAKSQVPNAQFFLMDMSKLTFPNEFFHGVWSCGSFYHLNKKISTITLAGFNRVLKKGGILFLAIKMGKGEKIVCKEEYNKLPKFYAFYKVEEIIEELEKRGFRIINTILEKKRDVWINIYAQKI